MTKNIIIILTIFFLTCCSDNTNITDDNSKNEIVARQDSTVAYKAPKDSVDVQFVPIFNKKITSTAGHGPIIQVLLDTILQYKKIRQFVQDSSATVYLLNELKDGADLSKKSFRISTKNISVAICNLESSGCLLNLKFNYDSKSVIVLNYCNGQDSLSLYQWNEKNCW